MACRLQDSCSEKAAILTENRFCYRCASSPFISQHNICTSYKFCLQHWSSSEARYLCDPEAPHTVKKGLGLIWPRLYNRYDETCKVRIHCILVFENALVFGGWWMAVLNAPLAIFFCFNETPYKPQEIRKSTVIEKNNKEKMKYTQ